MFENHLKSMVKTQSNYEKSIKISHKKDFGIFFTNNLSTVDKILEIVNFEDADLLSKKFLEPSCGNGIFIVRFLEIIFRKNINIKTASKFIESNIFFVDIDKKMIEVTKTNIKKLFKLIFLQEYKGKFNAFVFDFTQKIVNKKNNLLENVLNIPFANYLEKMDYVIGNPPYVSLYGRRDRKKNEAQRVYYLNSYSQFPKTLKNGKINYVMLFIEQSINFLKMNGKISFIIDSSFFETAYQYTRKFLLDKTKILSIEYNIKDFNVASGQIILKLQKTKIKHNLVQIIDSNTGENIEVDQSSWYKPKDQFKFRFNMCSLSAAIVDKIKAKHCPTLKKMYPKKNLRTCVMLLGMEKFFVLREKKTEKNIKIYKYYQGAKGLKGKYQKMENTMFFHYNKELQNKINNKLKKELVVKGIKNKKRIGFGETIIYDNPKVYIRQSAKEIIASYDEKPSAANNSLYVFTLRNSKRGSIIFLKFLCGLLNSDVITFYSQQLNIIRFSKGKQPQIKISDLYQIPIPTKKSLQLKISNLVDGIYSNPRNIENNKNEINRIFNEYFGLSMNELKTMKRAILNF